MQCQDKKILGLHWPVMASQPKKKGHQFSRWATAAPGSGIFYLDAFDTVFVVKGGIGKLSQGEIMNNSNRENILKVN